MFFMNRNDGDINPVAKRSGIRGAPRPPGHTHQQVHPGDAQAVKENGVEVVRLTVHQPVTLEISAVP